RPDIEPPSTRKLSSALNDGLSGFGGLSGALNDELRGHLTAPLRYRRATTVTPHPAAASALLVHLSGRDDADEREQGQRSVVEAGHGQFAGGADQGGEDERGETAEDRHAEAVGDRHTRAAHLDGEQPGQQ